MSAVITLRRATPADTEALAGLKRATFRETFVDQGGFGIPYPPDDLAAFEQATYAVPAIAAELADAGHATWLVTDEETALGYAHVGPCKLPHPEVAADAGEIYQLYTLARAQGLGIGRRLLDVALDHLARTRPGPVWLGVWSGNGRAQAIYAGRGFRKVGSYRFSVGGWHDDEFIYRRDPEGE
ncbi:MAG: GNAT family N-acetyltransferase [Novosphingobium sp.]